MKKILTIIIVLVFLCSIGIVYAAKPNFQDIDVIPSNGHATITIPEHAVEVTPGVFSLGNAVADGQVVEGYMIVHYKEGFGKPGTQCGNGVCEPGENAKKCPSDCGGGEEPPVEENTCYGYLASGAKWKSVEPYVVNPANNEGLDETLLIENLALDIDKWETAANYNILGDGSITTDTLVADTSSPDNVNEVYFADIADEGAIGVTIVWGIFRGAPKNRELVEWDQIYDEVDFDWSLTGEIDKMDFGNIATHELGHSVGMGDLYTAECSEQTMYGYATEGETKKQSLEGGDIYGVLQLYS